MFRNTSEPYRLQRVSAPPADPWSVVPQWASGFSNCVGREWNRGRFVPRCVLSQPREAAGRGGETMEEFNSWWGGQGGGTARPLALLFASFLIDFFYSGKVQTVLSSTLLPLSLCIAPLHRLSALRSLHLFRFLFPPPPFAPAIVVVLLPLFLSHTCSFWQRPHIIFTLSLDSKGSECEALLQTFVLQTICSLCFLHSCSLADFSSCSSLQGLFSSNNNPPRIGTARSVHHGKAFKKFLPGELLIV